ncbi:MAG: hypothetical protein ACE5HI_02595 [bacterium]
MLRHNLILTITLILLSCVVANSQTVKDGQKTSGQIIELPWQRLASLNGKMLEEGSVIGNLEVEYISKGIEGQPDIKGLKQPTTARIEKGVPVIALNGDFYADLAWIDSTVSPNRDYGLNILLSLKGVEWIGGTYGEININSQSSLTLRPLFPANANSSAVKASGRLECLFAVGSNFQGYYLPLFFVHASEVTLILKKSEKIKYKGKSLIAEEDAEIQLQFDTTGKLQEKILKGRIRTIE